jgi:ribose-phosphate pyrophosphokinase
MLQIENKKVDFTKFPNGETNIVFPFSLVITPVTSRIDIHFLYEEDGDLIKLLFLKKHLDSNFPGRFITLHVKYFPYSRMDREKGGTVFTLKYVTEFINSLNFQRVLLEEVHSDVTLALLNHCVNSNTTASLYAMIPNKQEGHYVLYPDAGAEKRYSSQIAYPKVLVGSKTRDWATGVITGLTIYGDQLQGQEVYILDDLCSRGGTFMASAKALKEKGAGDIYLVVAHCENTILEGDIFKTDLIKKVYTTDSIIQKDKATERLEIHE